MVLLDSSVENLQNTTNSTSIGPFFYGTGIFFSVSSCVFYMVSFLLSIWFIFLSWQKYSKKKKNRYRYFHLFSAIINTQINVNSIFTSILCQFLYCIADMFSFVISLMDGGDVNSKKAEKIRMSYVSGSNPLWIQGSQFAIFILCLLLFIHRNERLKKMVVSFLVGLVVYLIFIFFAGGAIFSGNFLKLVANTIGGNIVEHKVWNVFNWIQTFLYFSGTVINFVVFTVFFLIIFVKFISLNTKREKMKRKLKRTHSLYFKMYLILLFSTSLLVVLNVVVFINYVFVNKVYEEVTTLIFLFFHVLVDICDLLLRYTSLHVRISVVHRVMNSNEGWIKEVINVLKEKIYSIDDENWSIQNNDEVKDPFLKKKRVVVCKNCKTETIIEI